jgi:hypothetical protein
MLFQTCLQESIDGDTGIFYHRSPSISYHEFLLNNEVQFGKRVGLLDGPGIYTTYKLKDQMNDRMIDLYGEYIFELKMKLARIMFFDFDAFQKTTRCTPEHTKENFIIKQFEELEIGYPSVGKKLQNDLNKLTSGMTSDVAHDFSDWMIKKSTKTNWGLKGPASGNLFTGRLDGRVLVIWNAYAAVPY